MAQTLRAIITGPRETRSQACSSQCKLLC